MELKFQMETYVMMIQSIPIPAWEPGGTPLVEHRRIPGQGPDGRWVCTAP